MIIICLILRLVTTQTVTVIECWTDLFKINVMDYSSISHQFPNSRQSRGNRFNMPVHGASIQIYQDIKYVWSSLLQIKLATILCSCLRSTSVHTHTLSWVGKSKPQVIFFNIQLGYSAKHILYWEEFLWCKLFLFETRLLLLFVRLDKLYERYQFPCLIYDFSFCPVKDLLSQSRKEMSS